MKRIIVLLLAVMVLFISAAATDVGEPPADGVPAGETSALLVPEEVVQLPESEPEPIPDPDPEPIPELTPDPIPEAEHDPIILPELAEDGLIPVPELPDFTAVDGATGSAFDFYFNFTDLKNLIDFISTGILVEAEPPPREGVAGIVRAVLGEYTPRTYTVEYFSLGSIIETDTQYVPGLAGLDWEWIAGAVLFGLVLYCLLRMIGGLFK